MRPTPAAERRLRRGRAAEVGVQVLMHPITRRERSSRTMRPSSRALMSTAHAPVIGSGADQRPIRALARGRAADVRAALSAALITANTRTSTSSGKYVCRRRSRPSTYHHGGFIAPFERLCAAQSACPFDTTVGPPRDQANTWSTSTAGEGHRPHATKAAASQRPPARARTVRRGSYLKPRQTSRRVEFGPRPGIGNATTATINAPGMIHHRLGPRIPPTSATSASVIDGPTDRTAFVERRAKRGPANRPQRGAGRASRRSASWWPPVTR